MTDKLVKLIQDNPKRFKGLLEDLIIAYEEYRDTLNIEKNAYTYNSEDIEEQINDLNSDIEFARQLRDSIL